MGRPKKANQPKAQKVQNVSSASNDPIATTDVDENDALPSLNQVLSSQQRNQQFSLQLQQKQQINIQLQGNPNYRENLWRVVKSLSFCLFFYSLSGSFFSDSSTY
jgi:hypothetical protein